MSARPELLAELIAAGDFCASHATPGANYRWDRAKAALVDDYLASEHAARLAAMPTPNNPRGAE